MAVKIRRQLPNGQESKPPPEGGSVFDRIAPVRETTKGRLRFAVYGNPKTGKTRFACTFPKPMLLIGTEDGTASVVGTKGLDFVRLRHTDELRELIDGPLMEGRWRSAALDTATKLRDMRLAEIKGLDRVPAQKSFGYASRDEYIRCAADLKDVLSFFLDLPRQAGANELNVLVLAHEQNFKQDDGKDSDLVLPTISCALGESVARFVCGECDYVCQTLIRNQTRTVTKRNMIGGKEHVSEETEYTGKREFCLRTEPHPVYMGGVRVPLGRPAPPPFLVDPTYDKFLKLLGDA